MGLHLLDPPQPGYANGLRFAGAGLVTWKEKRKPRALGTPTAAAAAADRSTALTATRSPVTNGRSGTNCVPRPPGCAVRVPACDPLREPTTRTEISCAGASAGKSMRVPGGTSGVPG